MAETFHTKTDFNRNDAVINGKTTKQSALTLQFPSELGTPATSADGNSFEHFVVFYINTQQNDRYFGEGGSYAKRTSPDSPAYNTVQHQTQAGVLDKAITDAAKSDSTMKNLIAEAATTTKALLRVKSWKRTTMMVALPMPMQLSKSYNANWSNLSTAGGLGSDLIVGGVKGTWDKFVQEQLNKSPILKAKAGRVLNPRTESMFESVVPGSNQFDWSLYPKSPEESKAIWDIIQVFKWAMLPDVDKDNLYYDIPNTVDIEYWYKDARNDWLPKSMTSYIRNMSVNYCPSGHWVALNNNEMDLYGDWPSGAPPVGVNITLDLGELTSLDKTMIDPDGNLSFGLSSKSGTF